MPAGAAGALINGVHKHLRPFNNSTVLSLQKAMYQSQKVDPYSQRGNPIARLAGRREAEGHLTDDLELVFSAPSKLKQFDFHM